MNGTPGSQAPRNTANCVAGSACYLPLVDMVFGATMIYKDDLHIQGSDETPKHCRTLTSNGAFQNYWRNQSGSTVERASVQKNGAPPKKSWSKTGKSYYDCHFMGQAGTFISGKEWKRWILKQRKLYWASFSHCWEEHGFTLPEIARNKTAQTQLSALASM